ncbi:MAG: hypothetical protein GMKNLPBB_02531 [Myxococcota bacterium]|nr:hypothetical protein [Myxococcota bacterium]
MAWHYTGSIMSFDLAVKRIPAWAGTALLGLMLILPSAGRAQDFEPAIATGGYNARIGPEKEAPKVFFVSKNDPVKLIQRHDATWALIENMKGERGYYPLPMLKMIPREEFDAVWAPATPTSMAAPEPQTLLPRGKTIHAFIDLPVPDDHGEVVTAFNQAMENTAACWKTGEVYTSRDLIAKLGPTGSRLAVCTDGPCIEKNGAKLGFVSILAGSVRVQMNKITIMYTRYDGKSGKSESSYEINLKSGSDQDYAKLAVEVAKAFYNDESIINDFKCVTHSGKNGPIGDGTRGSGMKIAAWSMAGLAVAGIATGVTGMILRNGAVGDLNTAKETRAPITLQAIDDNASKANTFTMVSIVGYGVGGAAAAASIILFVLDSNSSAPPARSWRLFPVAGPGQAGLNLQLEF